MADLGSVHVFVVGLLAFAVTALALWLRFAERRLWSTWQTVVLYVWICLLSAAIAAGVSNLDPAVLRYAAIGVSYPLWAPRPDRAPRKSGDGKLTSDESKALGFLVNLLWGTVGHFTSQLDTRLANLKTDTVRIAQTKLETDSALAVERGDMSPHPPLWERVNAAMQTDVNNLTDDRLRDTRKAKLIVLRQAAEGGNPNIEPFVSLAYDWRTEERLRRLFEPPKPLPPTLP